MGNFHFRMLTNLTLLLHNTKHAIYSLCVIILYNKNHIYYHEICFLFENMNSHERKMSMFDGLSIYSFVTLYGTDSRNFFV